MRLILLILFSVCYADVIHVPADYSTIQSAIDVASDSDTILVHPGTYYEPNDFYGLAPNMGAFEFITGDCLGCTDESACNYDDTILQDDGSCEYPKEGYDCEGN